MKKHTEKDFINWVNSIVDSYKDTLGLGLCEITVKKGEVTEYLSFGINHPYLDSNLYYSDKALEDFKKGTLSKWAIVHEMCHAITDRFYSVASDRYIGKNELEEEREHLTDTIAAIIRKLE